MAPGRWPADFRVLDIVFVSGERAENLKETHAEGGPDLVVEIRSEGDESYEKLGFYEAIGVRELLVIDAVSLQVELFRLTGKFVLEKPDAGGWNAIAAVGLEIRRSMEEPRALELRDPSADSVERVVPAG